MGATDFIPESAQSLNASITISALIVGVSQLLFLFNMFWSLRHGEKSGHNPWNATSLEWQTPDVPPRHGNWGDQLPQVHRWAYDYSVPGVEEDFIPQNHPVSDAEGTAGDDEETS
jgi:cytochrome c oxidase subunit 1